jgi:hypothetical protein
MIHPPHVHKRSALHHVPAAHHIHHFVYELFLIAALFGASMVSFNRVLPLFMGTLLFDAHYKAVVLYYLFWAACTLYLFPFSSPPRHFISQSALAFGLGVIVLSGTLYTYIFTTLLGSVDANAFFGVAPGALFVPTFAFWISKITEILFQQLLIYALVTTLYRHLHSVLSVTIWTCLLFTTAHLLLYFTLGIVFTAVFMCASAAASCAFPYLILRVRGGIVYTCALHVMFYVVLSGVLISIVRAA